MRKLFETIKDRDYFDSHYPTAKKYSTISKAGQILSFATETVVFYLIIYQNFGYLLPAGQILSGVLAVATACILELALRVTTTDVATAMVKPGVWSEDKAGTVAKWIFLLFFYIVSGTASFHGSNIAAEKVLSDAKQISTAPMDSTYTDKSASISADYSTDSMGIAKRYQDLARATQKAYKSKISIEYGQIKKYTDKQAAENISYSTKIKYHNNKVRSIRAERDGKLLILQSELSNELQTAKKIKDDARAATDSLYRNERTTIISDNRTAKEKRDKSVAAVGGIVGWFTVAMLLFLFYSTYAMERVKYKAGVTYAIHLSDNELDTPFLSELFAIIGEKISFWLRSRLYGWANRMTATPSTNKKIYKSPFYDYNGVKQSSTTIATGAADPLPVSQIGFKFSTKPGDDTAPATGDDTSKKPGDDKPLYDHRKDASKRKKTGDGSTGPKQEKETVTVYVEREKLGRCKHCQKEYRYKSAKQKFCSDTCRKMEWKKQNGREPYMRKKK